jgi:glycosyltransferase involved in cell wall biosynthesis
MLRFLASQNRDFEGDTNLLLSIVMPVYNEAATLEQAFARVMATPITQEFIIVDDGSTDGTGELLSQYENLSGVRVLRQAVNQGKGAAIRAGFAVARGDIVIIQDADLEYDPADYQTLIDPIQSGEVEVVYGTRFSGGSRNGVPFKTYWANRVISGGFNAVHRSGLSDVETCYKAVRRDVLQSILPTLTENRFGIEIELTAKLAKLKGVRMIEVPISYCPRSLREGKKIGWRDGVRAMWCIWRYR